jgi:membrane fusion protein (multidrug efflux system)
MSSLPTPALAPAGLNHRAESAPHAPAPTAGADVPNAAPGSDRTPAKKKRGPLFWVIVSFGLVAASAWTMHFVYRMIVFQETDDAYVAGHLHQVSSRLDGSVTEVLVEENQPVKAGQLLARLDPLPFEIALQKSKAALSEQKAGALQAQAALDQARAQKTQAEAQVASAEAEIQRIAAQLEIANTNFGRNQRLFRDDARAVSKADVDTTKSTAEASIASLAGAKADAAAARSRVAGTAAAIESAQARLLSAAAKIEAEAAAVRDAERELSYVEIRAPADGRIGNKNVECGNRVQIGQALFALVGRDCWIIANFKETQLKQMRPGQAVEIAVDSAEGHPFTGKVDSFAPATGAEFALLPPDNATGNFTKVVQRVPIKIVFDPATLHGFEDRLSPGLSTVVSVRVK